MATSKQKSTQKPLSLMMKVIIRLIRTYQYLLSPFLGNNCRFYPSCSSYTIQALETHGLFKGSLLSIKRISKCHPWHDGGFDYVPPNDKTANKKQTNCCKPTHCELNHHG